ncbi:MAG: VWA domain-containing protein, partial [Aestuariibacter sp.]|nr:VWA domain-containing protein [Aestuariibacter sp.]
NDVSGSVDSREHQQSKAFITALGLHLSPLGTGVNESRIGISQWATGNNFEEYSFPSAGATFTTSQSDLIAYTNSARPFGGGTNPYKALSKAYQWVQQDPLGAPRNGQPIIVLMTDASCFQIPGNISNIATQIKNSGITLVVMAIDAAASCSALTGEKVASPGAYFAAADYATLQNNALAYINSITNVTCDPPTPYIDLSPAISFFEIINCSTTPAATLNYTITNSGNTAFIGTLDVAFYNGNPTVPGTQYLFTESVVSPLGLTANGGTYAGSTGNAALQNAGTVYAVVNIDGSLAANAVPLSPTLNGATLSETETGTGNNISTAYTRTDGAGCLPYAHIDVQVSHSGQVCDNQLIYFVEVCNIGTADFEMDAITPYADASFALEETQLVGTDPFVGSTLPAGACATYHYTYNLDGATPGTTYDFSVDVKEFVATCRDLTTTVVDVTDAGYTWMDRNLGASQQPTFWHDPDAWGDLYQWGRCADGHQLRTSSTTSTNATTAEPSQGNAWDGLFIIEPNSPYDWLATQDDNLWQGVNGTNNPCPAGYRLPTEAEFTVLRTSWPGTTINDAYNSALKMPTAGQRYSNDGGIGWMGEEGYYWSSTVNGTRSQIFLIDLRFNFTYPRYRADGFSVRCLKD